MRRHLALAFVHPATLAAQAPATTSSPPAPDGVMLAFETDLAEHYSQLSVYMPLLGMVPPSALPPRKRTAIALPVSSLAVYAGRARGGRIVFVELEATQEERLRRNATEFRLAEKPSKRDVQASRERLLADDARYRLNSGGSFDDRPDWFRIDTTALAAADVAERIIARFGLEREA